MGDIPTGVGWIGGRRIALGCEDTQLSLDQRGGRPTRVLLFYKGFTTYSLAFVSLLAGPFQDPPTDFSNQVKFFFLIIKTNLVGELEEGRLLVSPSTLSTPSNHLTILLTLVMTE